MSDITCDLQGITAKNLLRLSSLCDSEGNTYLKTDYSAEVPPSPLNLVTSCPCEFWFDGQDAGTLSLNGNRVIQWDDKSGNANHLANAVDANRPTYNPVTGRLTFIDLNGTYLTNTTIALTQPNTIYILMRVTSDVNNFVYDGITSRQLMRRNGGFFDIWAGVGFACAHVADNNDHIHAAEFNGAASHAWLDGVDSGVGNPGAAGLIDFNIGASNVFGNGMDGDIMEVFGYDCALTAAERTALDAYLTSKWGL